MRATRDLVLVVVTFVVVAIVVIVIGAALETSVVWLAMLIGLGAALLQHRRLGGPGPGAS